MDARDPKRPSLDMNSAREIVEGLYGLTGTLNELPSERDQNFHLITDSGTEFVLKIAAESEKLETLDFQNRAMQCLAAQSESPRAPQIHKTIDGNEITQIKTRSGKTHYVRLVSYIPGCVMASVNPQSPDMLVDFGRFVGSISKSLTDFDHPATHREFYWDLKLAPDTIGKFKDYILDPMKQKLVERFLNLYETLVEPHLEELRTSVIHNDANDNNVIVSSPYDNDKRSFGILDFGDMVHSHTINELAIAIAYAILEKPDPIGIIQKITYGYHSVFPLTETELELLFPLICIRLTTSVCVSAYQKRLEPDNEYLIISEKPAWDLLSKLIDIHPRYAMYCIRAATGLEPCPSSSKVINWLKKNKGKLSSPIGTRFDSSNSVVLDLSVGSTDVSSPHQLADYRDFSNLISTKLDEAKVKIGIGRYNEPRLIYSGDQYRTDTDENRTIHIAIDIFLEKNTPIYSIYDGIVHSFKNNDKPLDNGPTIVIEYQTGSGGPSFFVLYSHLSENSLDELSIGKKVKKGEQIGNVGEYPENGGWPCHLHFQLIIDMMDWEGDMYGVAPPSKRNVWLSICPDPNLILQIPASIFPKAELNKDEILSIRHEHIGRSLSISYKTHLKIVRGYMQYLYDENGKQYLDMRNNVPQVGHSNPRIVRALSQQAAVLNTNTRYLHDNLAKYAERLCSKLPKELSVCFFVNSGSEANELALRLARTHTNQNDIIAIAGAYHGNTSELINISSYKHDGPGGVGAPPHVQIVRMPDPYRGEIKGKDTGKKYAADVQDAIERINEHGRKVAAFICEPLMGCGGQIVFPEGYLKEAFRHVRKAGGICIADEVQVGFGRMGSHFWGFETQGVVPDIVTMGKPIGNGHPIGAVVTTKDIADSFATGMEFFSTTGGNTVSCAVGLAVLDEIENEHLQQNSLEVGTYLKTQLSDLMHEFEIIGDVRGHGLFIGVELVRNRESLEPAEDETRYIVERMKDLGVLVSLDGPYNNVLKIKPPLVFTRANADTFVNALATVLSEDPASI
ncbi:MAG: aminotransferase class III-fold pyridoxal phosphate-dependent enzyme [Candidatus Thorarchaeota archaeon]